MMFTEFDQQCMQAALQQAKLAASLNEVPVGAVLVYDHKIIATGYNRPISTCDPTAHAEIIALRNAAQILNNYRLINTTMYVTLEPCAMCASAMLHARVQRLVFATPDIKTGAIGGAIDLYSSFDWNHKIQCEHGLLADDCSQVIRDFFKQRRN